MTDSRDRRVVFVTGGRGRLGRLLVDALRARGHRAVSVARAHPGASHPDDVEADLTDADAVTTALAVAEADVVVHLASVLRGDDVEAVNRRIDGAVAGAIRSAGVRRVVHASSGAVYGVRAEAARHEDSPLDPSGPYARSKLLGERIFAELADRDGAVSVSSLRIFNVAGPSFADSLVHRIIHADAADPVRVLGPDRFIRDYIHQDDLVDVLGAAVERAAAGAHVVNVGAGVAVSTRMLLDRIRPDPAAVIESPGEPSVNWADVSAMVERFGIRPRTVPDRSWA